MLSSAAHRRPWSQQLQWWWWCNATALAELTTVQLSQKHSSVWQPMHTHKHVSLCNSVGCDLEKPSKISPFKTTAPSYSESWKKSVLSRPPHPLKVPKSVPIRTSHSFKVKFIWNQSFQDTTSPKVTFIGNQSFRNLYTLPTGNCTGPSSE